MVTLDRQELLKQVSLDTNSIHSDEDSIALAGCTLGLSNVHVATLGESFVAEIVPFATLMCDDTDIERTCGASAQYEFAKRQLGVVAYLGAFWHVVSTKTIPTTRTQVVPTDRQCGLIKI